MKKVIIFVCLALVFIVGVLVIYPTLEFQKNGYLYLMTYGKEDFNSKDFKEVEEGTFCYDESYLYNSKRKITIINYDYKGFLFFKYFKINYEKGNKCSGEFVISEDDFRNIAFNAVIEENEDNVDLVKLIEGKEAILVNKRYEWLDDYKYLNYTLNGEFNEMYITERDGMIVFQVGNNDEGPKFIAYK